MRQRLVFFSVVFTLLACLFTAVAWTHDPHESRRPPHEGARPQPKPDDPTVPDKSKAGKNAEEEAPWKVTEPHGPTHKVLFHTDEGTWIALDVHPDGTRLVFSLLGDLYLLPIEGGEARRLTSGPAYDVQPRFSPEGTWIAFASDRGGTENLWICDLEGKQARQISTEKAHTVNSPAWTPDGQYLVGRKRLTDLSSLGTVELWMWHLRGGEGLQITKQDKQPDAADPTFSPDDRFLYFSARDARYQYNRDVYEGIWQIKRFDRRTGQIMPLTGEYGGAATPAFSPDGKTMTFVRRQAGNTVLEAMDMSSGALRRIASGVQRDNQEGFCFHGVFPGYDWTPDGRAVIATADGRIWRYDVASGKRTPIPFRAAVEQTLSEVLRFPQELGGDTMRARVLRWPVESPDGKRLVFSAVGQLYAMALPDGTPQRVTRSKDLEYAPAFSRDGSLLTFVTWNDREGGHVWVMPAEGGRARQLTTVPGQYANPAFSPDGKWIVYLRGSGATFRDNDLAGELWEQLYLVPAAGGESQYVIGTGNRGQNRRMTRPSCSPDGTRIFFIEDEPAEKPNTLGKTVLVSVQLDGTDRKAHLRWNYAEEAAVSPDGNWVAFSELHNAHVTSLPAVGDQTVDVALENPAVPVTRLSDEGGEWVSWADGGKTITFIYGPSYRRVALDDAVKLRPTEEEADSSPGAAKGQTKRGKDKSDDAKAAQAKKDKPLPPAQTIEVKLSLPRARPQQVVAYTNARIVTMRGDEVIELGNIIVSNDRITKLGPASDVAVPAGAKLVDLEGKTVIPGLVDAHAHLHYSTLDIFPQRPWKYLANLAYGVTTTHDPSASTQEVFGQAEMVEAGAMIGPRVFSTGFILYGAENAGRARVESLDDARKHLRRLKSLGAFSVKSYMQPRREQRQWVVQAAREERMMVVPEGGGDLEMDMTMILDGHTTLEHALPIVPLYDDVVTLFAKSGTAYTPTLLVAYGGIAGDKWFHQHYDLWKDARLTLFIPPSVLDPLARIRDVMAPDEEWHHLKVAASARDVVRAGGRVLLGGHGQMQGLGPHWELWAFVQGGMTPLEALRVGTLYPAEALGLDRHIGSLEPGKLADFVVLERNPLERIENSDSVTLVVKNGVGYTLGELERQAAASSGMQTGVR